MNIFFIGVLLLFLGGILARFFDVKKKIPFLSCVAFVSTVLCLTVTIPVLADSKSLSSSFSFNNIFGDVTFVIDSLAAFFIVVISLMSFLGVIYSKGYLKKYIDDGKSIDSHLVFLSSLIASMLLVVTCQNALMFLICWELMIQN